MSILLVFKLVELTLVVGNLSAKDASNFYGVSANKSRIILVGSSNLDFNYDYKLLNQTFEKYDVVGCNLNEPSGLYATLHKLKKLEPRDNDILIFAIPHSLYEPAKLIPLGSSGKKGFTTRMLRQSFRDFPKRFIESVVDIKTSDMFKLQETKASSQQWDNEIKFNLGTEADSLSDFLDCKKLKGSFDITSNGFDKEYLMSIQDFLNDNFESNVWFRYPAVKQHEIVVDGKRLEFLNDNYDFMNDFTSSIYSDEYWYNQWYHLNYCGRKLNTQKLIAEINLKLNQ